jgi:hypothetical protein
MMEEFINYHFKITLLMAEHISRVVQVVRNNDGKIVFHKTEAHQTIFLSN